MLKNTLIQKVFFLIIMILCVIIFALNVFVLFVRFLPVNVRPLINYFSEHIIFLMIITVLTSTFVLLYLRFRKSQLLTTYKIKNYIIYSIIIFTCSLLLKALFVIIIKTPQYSDFQLFYWVTAEIAKNTPRYLSQSYFGIWAYQVGFPAIMSIIIRIFGQHVNPLLMANCVFMAVNNVFVYLIARQLIKENYARLCAIIYMFLPFTIGLSSVYTNQHLANMLFYIGIYVFTYKMQLSLRRAIIAGIILSLGNAVRPEGIAIVSAIIALFILISFNRDLFKKENIKLLFRKSIIPIFACVFSYFVCFFLISQFFIITGLNPYGLTNRFPLYKLVVGLNQETSGTFSKEDSVNLFESNYYIQNPDLRNSESLKIIKERLSVGPMKLLKLFEKKIEIMWTNDNNIYPAFNNISIDGTTKFIGLKFSNRMLIFLFTFIDSLIFILIFGLCALSMFFSYKSKENSIIFILLSMLFLITFIVYLFIEVQHRYSYFIIPGLFILAMPAVNKIRDYFKKDKVKSLA